MAPEARELVRGAVETAIEAGGSYADARLVVRRRQLVETSNGRVAALVDETSEGIGVRVLVDGAWGFACDRDLSVASVRDAALQAASFARAAGPANVRLAETEPCSVAYRSPVLRDPFAVPPADKVDLCLCAEESMRGPAIASTRASLRALEERTAFRSSLGSEADLELVECGGGIDAIAVGDRLVQVRSFPNAFTSSAQAGWEHVEALGLEDHGPRVAEEAAALLRAPECPAERTTVVLDAALVAHQLHESIGHAVELDRVFGTERSYAGTSFLRPSDLGVPRYGSPLVNVVADPETPGGLGSVPVDDEGVPTRRETLVEAGVLRGFLSSRETAARLGRGRGGSMRADGWNRTPLIRMLNLHLLPGAGSLEELVGDVEDGIYLGTTRSWSIWSSMCRPCAAARPPGPRRPGGSAAASSARCCATRRTPERRRGSGPRSTRWPARRSGGSSG